MCRTSVVLHDSTVPNSEVGFVQLKETLIPVNPDLGVTVRVGESNVRPAASVDVEIERVGDGDVVPVQVQTVPYRHVPRPVVAEDVSFDAARIDFGAFAAACPERDGFGSIITGVSVKDDVARTGRSRVDRFQRQVFRAAAVVVGVLGDRQLRILVVAFDGIDAFEFRVAAV